MISMINILHWRGPTSYATFLEIIIDARKAPFHERGVFPERITCIHYYLRYFLNLPKLQLIQSPFAMLYLASIFLCYSHISKQPCFTQIHRSFIPEASIARNRLRDAFQAPLSSQLQALRRSLWNLGTAREHAT